MIGFSQGIIETKGASNVMDMFRDNKAMTQSTQQVSLFQKVLPTHFTNVTANTGALKRDATMGAGDLHTVQNMNKGVQANAMQARGAAEAAWDHKQNMVAAVIKDVATEKGVNPHSALSVNNSSGLGAAANIATAGLGGPMVQAAQVAFEAYGEGKKMKPGELEEFMQEVANRISSPSVARQQEIQAFSGTAGAPAIVDAELAELDGKELLEFVQTDFKDLPEIVELDNLIEQTREVENNHVQVAEAAHDNTGNKLQLAMERDDVELTQKLAEQDYGSDVTAVRIALSDQSYGGLSSTKADVTPETKDLMQKLGVAESTGAALKVQDPHIAASMMA